MRFQHKKIMKLLSDLNITLTRREMNSRAYFAQGKRNYMEWWVEEDGSVVQVNVHSNGNRDDIMSDYFCGWFPKTYKRIKEDMDE